MDKKSYALGMSVAHNLIQSGVKDLNSKDFASAVEAVVGGKQPELSFEEAGKILDAFFKEIESEQAAEQAEIAEVMKKQGEEFLAENKSKDGVIELPNGLQYKVLKEGDGEIPCATDKVKCHYEGRFIDGKVFDSSYKRGEAAVFGLNQVIKGWTDALTLMSKGSKWELYIPYTLAYGETGAPGAIPPYSTLIFTVELLDIL